MDAPSYADLGRNPFGDSSQQFDFFPTSMHHQVVMRIARGLGSRCGLILLTGEIGIGKTTLSRHIQQQFADTFTFAELGNPYLSPAEQLFHFCQMFEVPLPPGAGAKEQMDALTRHLPTLHASARSPVIIIDESHLLTRAHFGQILVLSNLRFETAPLVQILLVGQLELMDRLRESGLEALNQRIGVRCELKPLDLQESRDYIRFKLESGGAAKADLFESRAVERIWKVSGGLPRLINHISALALDQLTFSGRDRVVAAMIDEVSRDGMYQELFTTRTRKPSPWRKALPAAGILSAVIVVAVVASGIGHRAASWLDLPARDDPEASQAAAAPAPPATAADPPPASAAPARQAMPAPQTAPQPAPAPRPAPEAPQAAQVVPPAVEPEPERRPEPASAPPAKAPAPAAPAPANAPATADTSQKPMENAKDTSRKNDLSFIPDGSEHPVVGKITIDAVAWSDRSPERIVVLNEKVMREGDSLGTIRLDMIGRDYLLFSYQGELYKRRWHQ